MAPRILNVADLEFKTSPIPMPDPLKPHYEGSAIGDIGRRLGAQKLGYNVTLVPPGKRAFPFHAHRVNEEMFFVLAGAGEIRLGAERHPIKAGDFIACPPGDGATAHQIVNTSERDELRYLAVSTRLSPEVVDYPDSNKFGVAVETPGPDGKPQLFRFLGHPDQSLGYWDNEP